MDAYEGESITPLSLHKYLYTYANPVNNLDPSGFNTIIETTETPGFLSRLYTSVARYARAIGRGFGSKVADVYFALSKSLVPISLIGIGLGVNRYRHVGIYVYFFNIRQGYFYEATNRNPTGISSPWGVVGDILNVVSGSVQERELSIGTVESYFFIRKIASFTVGQYLLWFTLAPRIPVDDGFEPVNFSEGLIGVIPLTGVFSCYKWAIYAGAMAVVIQKLPK